MSSLKKYFWMVVICLGLVRAEMSHAITVTIDGSQTNQVIDGFGVNLNYQGWTNNDLKPVIDAMVDQGNFTLFRIVFNNTDWEGTNDNNNSNVMNWSYYNTIYSSPRFEQLWGLVAYLNQKGITNGIVFNFQGHGPTWMGSNNLTAGLEDEWAEMIASLLYYARNTRNLQFNLVAPENEPDNTPQGIHVNSTAQYVTMLHDLAVKLNTNGMSDVRFVTPDLAFTDTNIMAGILNDSLVTSKVSHFGLHSYSANGTGSTGVYNFLQHSAYPDRSLWMTEFNVNCANCEAGQYGTYDWSYCEGLVKYLFSHMSNGVSAGIVWEGYDSVYFILGQRWSFWGLFGVDNTNAAVKTYTPRKNFYTLSQLSKFIQPGAYSIDLTGATTPFQQLQAFYHPVTGEFTLTGINTSGGSASLTGVLQSLPAISGLELYYTSASSNLVHLPTVPVVNGANFTTSIPADCVFTLTSTPVMSATITNPVNGALFNSPANIPIQASVSSTVGTISQVKFFANTNTIGSDTAPPYTVIWSNAPPGHYSLTVSASNSLGNTAISPIVEVTVVGPLAQITVAPSNVTVAPLGTLQFSAIGTDAFGTELDPQPAFSWAADGGTIDSTGLFTAGPDVGGPFTVTVSNNFITASANITVLSNIAPSGIAYTWYSMSDSDSNSPRTLATAINDGDLDTDIQLQPNGIDELTAAWEAAGVVWSTPRIINRVVYHNGGMDDDNDGVFASDFGLQFSPDGTTWTNAGPEWTVNPDYTYSADSADVSFDFTGGQVTAKGVRCVGQLHTSEASQISWLACATELEVYPFVAAPPVLQAGIFTNSIVISWNSSITNYLLEAATNPVPPYSWTTVTNTPQSAGNQQQVVLAPTGARQLFRLRHQ